MTFGKAFALTTGFAGAFALGVLVGPSMTDGWRHSPSDASAVTEPAAPAATETPAPAPRARVNAPRASVEHADRTAATTGTVAVMPASTPELQQRLKSVLRSGAKMDVAADGFKSAEQFATVAHASRNTDVPFMLLKHRVVDEGKSVEAAIRESKPDLDASAESARARDQAREDVAALNSGN
jgi:hypothetical protein